MSAALHPTVHHIHLGQDHGGAETFFLKLAGALGRRGVPQTAFIQAGRIWADRLRATGCTVVELDFAAKGLKGKLSGWLATRAMHKRIRAAAPQIVLAWMNRAARRVPKGPWLKVARLGGYYKLHSYQACEHLVGNTPDLVAYMARAGWDPAKLHMISNFPDMQAAPAIDRSTMNTPADATVLVALGRLEAMKGFDVLLRALARLPDRFHLWLLGEGSLRGALTDQAAQLGLADRVRLPGWVPAPAATIAAADIFVCPSRHEPLGNVVLEGWALRKPVVAAASEGPVWLIEEGANGLLAPVEDDAALAAQVQRIADDPALAARLVAGANETLARDFSEAAIADAYLKLFSLPATK